MNLLQHKTTAKKAAKRFTGISANGAAKHLVKNSGNKASAPAGTVSC